MKGVITTEKLDDTVLCRKTGHPQLRRKFRPSPGAERMNSSGVLTIASAASRNS
ncbi:MAG: hypothetical protein Ct9H300mP16_10690 [Pseudomonadota bacterium]|nr:MAG: hypothetical protein Ct9H300mP16_10690 [Pseudomonadota bacterium]